MFKSFFIPLLLMTVLSCRNKTTYTLADFVEIEKIETVLMRNNSGTFKLSEDQLTKFKSEISTFTHDPNLNLKLGMISMDLIINGQSFIIYARTHGDYVEIDPAMVSKNKSHLKGCFFKTNGLNFDNYKAQIK